MGKAVEPPILYFFPVCPGRYFLQEKIVRYQREKDNAFGRIEDQENFFKKYNGGRQ